LKKFVASKHTVSNFSLNSQRQRFFVQLSIFLNGIWSIGFFLGLLQQIDQRFFSLLCALCIGIVFLFFMASVSLNQTTQKYHTFAGLSLLFCLTLLKVVVGIGIYSRSIPVGIFSLVLGIGEFIFILLLGHTRKRQITGVFEILYTTLLSIWVFVVSIYLLSA
jgi:hypothetical protein